jgi:hypothetical protein
MIQCKVDPDVARSRFRGRDDDHFAVDLDEDRVIDLAQSYSYRDSGLIIDATAPLDHSMDLILHRIAARFLP